jgi:hypothetical protein
MGGVRWLYKNGPNTLGNLDECDYSSALAFAAMLVSTHMAYGTGPANDKRSIHE